MNLSTKRVIFILIALIGILIIVIGILQDDNLPKTIFISIGGTILGASLSNFFSLIGMNIFEILSNTKELPNIDKGKVLDTFRKKYYCYYITKDKNNPHWRLYIEDYSKFVSDNYLLCNFKMKSDTGVIFEYDALGLLTKKRLITISKAKLGTEESVVYFFPNFGREYSERSVGLGVFESWDKTDMIAPMIISKSPIEGYKKIGRINNKELEDKLKIIVENELPEIVLS